MRKLYRSRQNRIFGGILGGIGEYLHVDPTVIRLIYLVLFVMTGGIPLGILYIASLFIIPGEDPH
ncbi:PspC domain-containing protein [Tuberibacillus sp. Marseille-P3662]|uniref:PspC domain-containing protein n=1 Tax=Tuberibacillus sp. Marseille-P3662 TaxID=1965358 RepID=UPI000A1CEB58|nr:PspC domain-containing protein [Tuberibacillus sp. Marseille-P3662]